MRRILTCISFFLLSFTNETSDSLEPLTNSINLNFKLHYMQVGFGSNMSDMQPIFKVDGVNFIYTSGEVWLWPGQTELERDTLLRGNFRTSSIDSILNFISQVQDTLTRKSNPYVMSGSASFIEISTGLKKISFHLHNSSDTTAEKIVSLLNSHIPKEYQKLYINKLGSDLE